MCGLRGWKLNRVLKSFKCTVIKTKISKTVQKAVSNHSLISVMIDHKTDVTIFVCCG